jgi:putative transcriptional regulator
MEPIPYSHITKGTLLVASPEIETGLYCRSVILICEHSIGGSFGLIVNKSLDVELPEEIINIKNQANPNVSIHAGGPIHPNQMMLLHSDESIPEQTLNVCPGVYLGGDLEFLQKSISDLSGPHIKLCFGYAGWGSGQLEREFLGGLWFLHPATNSHVFTVSVGRLWQTVLREMGGKYASLSMIPEDLSLN